MNNSEEQWQKMSYIFLNHISKPLRPDSEDLSICNELIQRISQDNIELNALILGVTPEYCNLSWPKNSKLTAVDKTIDMIKNVWPGKENQVILGNWEEVPLENQSIDLTLCDGGLHLLEQPEKLNKFVDKLSQITKENGYLLVRLFIPSTCKESTSDVLNKLISGDIPSLNYLKMRFASALQNNAKEGVKLSDIWDALHTIEKDQEKLSKLLNWDLDELKAINVYQNSDVKYHLMSVDEAIELFKNSFNVEDIIYPSYLDGQFYPTIILKKK